MTAGRTRPPSTIQRAGGTREPQPGRRITSTKRTKTNAKRAAAPAAITHHKVAIEAAAGPAGSSADSGPLQPDSVAAKADWTTAKWRLRCPLEPGNRCGGQV